MKFLGKTKDYYDHQAHVWGVDEKIIYDRSPFWEADPLAYPGAETSWSSKEFSIDGEVHFRYKVDGRDLKFWTYLAVCGKLFPLVYADIEGKVYPSDKVWMSYEYEKEPVRKWEIYRADHHVFVKEKESKWERRFPMTTFYSWQENILDLEVGQEVEVLTQLSKMVKQPIFLITRHDTTNRWAGRKTTKFTVSPYYHETSSMGLGQLISADRLYQDVGYWLSNIINPSPDIMPDGKPPQTDLEKVVSHGFDKKVSFRKRKPAD